MRTDFVLDALEQALHARQPERDGSHILRERPKQAATATRVIDPARYDESTADWMLPYLKARPVSLVCRPTGIIAALLFQQHDDKPSIAPRWEDDTVKDFSQAVAQHPARTIPSRFFAKQDP